MKQAAYVDSSCFLAVAFQDVGFVHMVARGETRLDAVIGPAGARPPGPFFVRIQSFVCKQLPAAEKRVWTPS